jgi:hypothetical protein
MQDCELYDKMKGHILYWGSSSEDNIYPLIPLKLLNYSQMQVNMNGRKVNFSLCDGIVEDGELGWHIHPADKCRLLRLYYGL